MISCKQNFWLEATSEYNISQNSWNWARPYSPPDSIVQNWTILFVLFSNSVGGTESGSAYSFHAIVPFVIGGGRSLRNSESVLMTEILLSSMFIILKALNPYRIKAFETRGGLGKLRSVVLTKIRCAPVSPKILSMRAWMSGSFFSDVRRNS